MNKLINHDERIEAACTTAGRYNEGWSKASIEAAISAYLSKPIDLEAVASALFNDWQRVLLMHSPELEGKVWMETKHTWMQQAQAAVSAIFEQLNKGE
jgi:response regulator RpfG family c-di-GMP phosphodiesterase